MVNWPAEFRKRKEGMLGGGVVGAILYFVAIYFYPSQTQPMMAAVAANPSVVQAAFSFTPSTTLFIGFVLGGMLIGSVLDNR